MSQTIQKILLQNMPGIVYLTDSDWMVKILSSSENFCGYSVDELNACEMGWLSLVHPEDREQVSREDTELTIEPQKRVQTYRIITRSGDILWVEDHKTSLFNTEGEFEGISGIVLDITERMWGQQSLWAAEEQFRAFASVLPDLTLILDEDGRYIEIISDSDNLLFSAREKMLGRLLSDVIPADVAQQLLAVIRRTIELDETQIIEYALNIDGEPHWFEGRTSLMYGVPGEKQRVMWIRRDITERELSEDILRKSEEHLNAVIQTAMNAIVSINNQGNIILWNSAAEEMFGYSVGEILGQSFSMIMPEQFREQHQQNIQRFVSSGGTKIIGNMVEWIGLRKGGIEFPIELSLASWKADQNVFFTAFIHDITERKQAENERNQLSRAVEQSPVSVMITNLKGNIEYVNPKFAEMTGYSYGEVIGKNPRILKSGVRSSGFYKDLWETISAGNEWRGELHNMKKNGEMYWELQTISAILDDQDEVTHFVAIKEDITERKQAQSLIAKQNQEITDHNVHLSEIVAERTKQLQRMNDRLTTILNTTSDAIILLDDENRIQNTNRSFDDLFGYEYDELFNQSIQVLVEADRQDELLKVLESIQKTRQPQRLGIPMRRKNGQTFESDTAMTIVKDNDNHYVCSIRDITHIKEVEKAKDRFVSMVSHEMRTPVTSLVLSADTLRRHYDRLTEDQKQKKLDRISQQARNLTELVTAILDISRFEARRNDRGKDIVDMAQSLQDVVTELVNPDESNPHHTDIQIYNNEMNVVGKYADISRIWRNLLSNAIKYTDAGGEIKVSLYGDCTQDPSHCQLPDLTAFTDAMPSDISSGHYIIGMVEDNGHGIRSEELSQLFTRFFRGWAASTNIAGTGLGLSLVRDILQLYGGDIVAISELDVGTTFCFWLPATRQKGSKK